MVLQRVGVSRLSRMKQQSVVSLSQLFRSNTLGYPSLQKPWIEVILSLWSQKIRARFLSWTSKALFFAGRLQLINSVIASMTNFWCYAFSLSQSYIDEIESMCSAFLWSGSPNITSKSKVAWEEVCKTEQEWGLWVRRIKDVSEVFALKLIWRLFNNSDSMWVMWVKQVILREDSFLGC